MAQVKILKIPRSEKDAEAGYMGIVDEECLVQSSAPLYSRLCRVPNKLWKSWKIWKIMKKVPCMEKSRNLKKPE